MISTTQAAAILGVSVQYLRRMAKAGRVPGAVHIGTGRRSMWVFPDKPTIKEKK
jgi:excisionase family DNA binding protein